MATASNEITGDKLQTKVTSQAFRDNYDAIFRKPKEQTTNVSEVKYSTEDKHQPQGMNNA